MEPIDWSEAEDATFKALPKTISDAEAGDPNAKRRLLDIFCAMVDAGQAPYPVLLAYVSRRFSQALGSQNAALEVGKVLLGGPSQRRRLLERDERDEALALAVHDLIVSGIPKQVAVEKVADEYGFTDGVVDHAWRRFKGSDLLKPI